MSAKAAQSPRDILHDTTDLRRWRMLTASRVFALSVALGLALTSGPLPGAAAPFLGLCALTAVMSLPMPASSLRRAAPMAEAALAALILVPSVDTASPLLVYLVIPPFVAGLQVGLKAAVATAAIQPLVAVAGLATGNQVSDLPRALEQASPWMLVGLGLGLLGAWVHAHTRAPGDQAGYESAHRLLGQLRAISRRLSSGLDTNALSDEMLLHTMDALLAQRAMALVRAEGGGLTALSGKGLPFEEHLEDDPSVRECWSSAQPHRRLFDNGYANTQHRTVLPLRVGARLIGVVVADGATAVDKKTISRLLTYLSEHSLRLEAALLFNEVRSMATLEERSRLAREIHDGIAQEIASLGYLVDDLTAGSSFEETQQAAHVLRGELSRVVSELRLSIFDLRSNVSPHAGLGLALSDYAREIGKRGGMTVHLALSERPQRLHINVETELLRIAQEAITNARKHARASNLWVTLNTESPIVMLRIEDDGVGSVEPRADHYGLRMMQERAERIGGELAITARRHGGTSVVVTVWPSTNPPSGAHRDNLSSSR